MRILLYDWESVNRQDIRKAFADEKIDFNISTFNLKNLHEEGREEEYKERLDEILQKGNYDAVFSVNFKMIVSEVCHRNGIMYISWSYDSPVLVSDVERFDYSTNWIFLFDSAELNKYKNIVKNCHLFHLNLATDVSRMNNIVVTQAKRLEYESVISFVGQLYYTDMQEIIEALPPYTKNYVKAVVETQLKNYDVKLVTDSMIEEMAEIVKSPFLINRLEEENVKHGVRKGTFSSFVFKILMEKVISRKERLVILALLSKYHPVKLFSTDKHEVLKGVTYGGMVDYYTEMPIIFKYSKINLNITFKGIEAAMPQRCLDIMGCHGFMLSNYQKDLCEEFEEGKEMVVYKSYEEAVEKADFYLKNEKQRMEIAENGYKKVRDCFNYHTQFQKIWKTTGLR